MAEDHASKLTEFKPDYLRIHFSPELKRKFVRLEAAVWESDHFDGDMLRVLQDLPKVNQPRFAAPFSVQHRSFKKQAPHASHGRHEG